MNDSQASNNFVPNTVAVPCVSNTLARSQLSDKAPQTFAIDSGWEEGGQVAPSIGGGDSSALHMTRWAVGKWRNKCVWAQVLRLAAQAGPPNRRTMGMARSRMQVSGRALGIGKQCPPLARSPAAPCSSACRALRPHRSPATPSAKARRDRCQRLVNICRGPILALSCTSPARGRRRLTPSIAFCVSFCSLTLATYLSACVSCCMSPYVALPATYSWRHVLPIPASTPGQHALSYPSVAIHVRQCLVLAWSAASPSSGTWCVGVAELGSVRFLRSARSRVDLQRVAGQNYLLRSAVQRGSPAAIYSATAPLVAMESAENMLAAIRRFLSLHVQEQGSNSSPIQIVCMLMLTAIALVWVLLKLSAVLVPLTFAIFLTFLVEPILSWCFSAA